MRQYLPILLLLVVHIHPSDLWDIVLDIVLDVKNMAILELKLTMGVCRLPKLSFNFQCLFKNP